MIRSLLKPSLLAAALQQIGRHLVMIGVIALITCGTALLVPAQSGRRVPEPKEKKETAPTTQSSSAIKIRTEEVRLAITVRDSLGQAVDGLKADDFFIYDNGQRYEPIRFEQRHVPVRLLLLLDASAGLFDEAETVRNALLAFHRTLRRDDRLAVMHFSDEIVLTQDWKNDEASFRQALRPVLRSGSKSAIYDALALAALKLREAEGRRAIVLLTNGLNTAGRLNDTQALAAIRSAEAALYVFSQTEAIASALRQNAPPPPERPPAAANKNESADSLLVLEKAERELTALAEETGGAIYFPLRASHLLWMLDETAHELHAQYLMTYLPQEEGANGYHRVEVMVRGGYTAHTRPGYQRQRFI